LVSQVSETADLWFGGRAGAGDSASEKASGRVTIRDRRLFVHVTLRPARVVEICRKKKSHPQITRARLRRTREQISD